MSRTALLAFAAIIAASPSAAIDLRPGGKLLLTNGITALEGASGGGIATWSVIGGKATRDGIGASAHATLVALPDFQWRSYGVAVGLFDRVELSYARQDFDTGAFGEALGIGRGYTFNQDVFGAKLRVAGDLVYDEPWLPQIAVGIQHKRAADADLARAVGAARGSDTDFYVSATKLFLAQSVLANATVRLTRANQLGLLGFGGDAGTARSVEFEGTLAYQVSRRFAIGAEYRTKPDNLGFAGESDWFDIFGAYALTPGLTLSAAYVDLGSIATSQQQRGAFVQLQAAF